MTNATNTNGTNKALTTLWDAVDPRIAALHRTVEREQRAHRAREAALLRRIRELEFMVDEAQDERDAALRA